MPEDVSYEETHPRKRSLLPGACEGSWERSVNVVGGGAEDIPICSDSVERGLGYPYSLVLQACRDCGIIVSARSGGKML